ncbi:hypothetical protein K438DRAFT_328354 [Mycena galopus ATCC 62051]|nr:hypothetical protein K438DRAFT_328354 [Mycena galopus ATCC 62051]
MSVLKQHGGRRVGSGRKSKEWHAARAAQELEALRAAQSRSSTPIQTRSTRSVASISQQALQDAIPVRSDVTEIPSQTPIREPHPITSTSQHTTPSSEPHSDTGGIPPPSRPVQPVASTSRLPLQHTDPFVQPAHSDTREVAPQDPILRHFHPNDSLDESSVSSNSSNHTLGQHLNQLAGELRFRALNDNPTASGDDEHGQVMGEVAATAGEAAKSSLSFLEMYLQTSKARIIKEIATHGLPQCYRLGDLFDRQAPDSIADTNGFTSGTLYDPDILPETRSERFQQYPCCPSCSSRSNGLLPAHQPVLV